MTLLIRAVDSSTGRLIAAMRTFIISAPEMRGTSSFRRLVKLSHSLPVFVMRADRFRKRLIGDASAGELLEGADEDSQYLVRKLDGRIVRHMRVIDEMPVGESQVVAPHIERPVDAVALMGQDHAVQVSIFPLERRIEDIPDKGAYHRFHIGVRLRDGFRHIAFQPDRNDARRREDLHGTESGQITDDFPARVLQFPGPRPVVGIVFFSLCQSAQLHICHRRTSSIRDLKELNTKYTKYTNPIFVYLVYFVFKGFYALSGTLPISYDTVILNLHLGSPRRTELISSTSTGFINICSCISLT